MGAASLSLRARIALAAVMAVALGGVVAGAVLLRAVSRDGRDAVDAQLTERAERLAGAPEGRFGGRPAFGARVDRALPPPVGAPGTGLGTGPGSGPGPGSG